MATVAAEIDRLTSDARVRLAMKLGALLEGGSLGGGPFPVGDTGTSYGPFQIHLPAHPGVSAAEASTPTFAVQYMLDSYLRAVASVSPQLWESDPKHAAALAAYRAERPRSMYPGSRIDAAWKALQSGGLLSGVANVAGNVVDFARDPVGAVRQAIGDAFQSATRPLLAGARNTAIITAFSGLGLVLIGMGAWQAFGPAVKRAGKVAASVATKGAV